MEIDRTHLTLKLLYGIFLCQVGQDYLSRNDFGADLIAMTMLAQALATGWLVYHLLFVKSHRFDNVNRYKSVSIISCYRFSEF